MFTGFASENTPAIQVWDFFSTFASTSAIRSVSLPDDCAPIQVFRTGATGQSAIRVYLPTAPIEGKQITFVNQQYGQNIQNIEIYSSDARGAGTSAPIFRGGPSSSIVLVYSKQNISFGFVNGLLASGWIGLNQSSVSSPAYASAIVGGDGNRINSAYGFIGGGVTHLVSGTAGVIVGGQVNTASGTNAAVIGGSGNTASGTNAFASGDSHIVSGQVAAAVGGFANTANSQYSAAIGGAWATTRSIIGNLVFAASSSPIVQGVGSQQLGTLLLGRQTTDATPTVLRSTFAAASTTNQVILPNNSAYAFEGTVIANVTGGGDTSGWKFEGVIKRGANAASTTLVAAVTPTVIAQDAGASAWVVDVTADTTNGGIAVTVTGAAATTIRWVCKIETTEVTY